MDKYLDVADAKRYNELIMKPGYLSVEERKELDGLMDKSLAKQIEIYGKPEHKPFEGKCLRCGKEVDNPVPEVTVPSGRHDIATSEWCAECNGFAMNVLLRWASAYRVKHPFDPVRGGKYAHT